MTTTGIPNLPRTLMTNNGTRHALSVVAGATTSDVLCGQFLVGRACWGGAVTCKRCARAQDAGRTASRAAVARRRLKIRLSEPVPGL